jgi:acetamidase/formamidase
MLDLHPTIKEKVGREGARTIPGRPEHGGNCDIKNLSRGSKVYLPVHVKGAKFSVGDLHFSQGDGEISFCGAIEMSGVITINFKVMKNGIADLGMKSPLYLPGPVEPHYGPGRYLTFEGFSVDEHGKQVSLTLHFCRSKSQDSKMALNCCIALHGRDRSLQTNYTPLHRVSSTLWVLRLPGLSAFVMCSSSRTCRWYCRHT